MHLKMNPGKSIIGLTIVLAFLLPYSPVTAREEIDWSKPDKIDVMDSSIGDFLDMDLLSYAERARDLFMDRKFEEAAQHYLFVLRYKYDDVESIYNLACCYGHLGKSERAAEFLDRAVRAGFQDFDQIEMDPSFEKVREKSDFKNILKKINAYREVIGKPIYVESMQLKKTRIRFPEDYEEGKSYPLVIGLHGYGANPEDFITIWEPFKDRDFIYVAPEAPYVRPKVMALKREQYSWSILERNDPIRKRASRMTESYILQVADRISSIYNTSDTYLLGFSQGAGFAYQTGIKHPDIFKGIICLSGRMPDTIQSGDFEKARPSLSVFIGYGKKERFHGFGVRDHKRLVELGFDVTFSDFDGGHIVSRDTLKEVQKWMKGS